MSFYTNICFCSSKSITMIFLSIDIYAKFFHSQNYNKTGSATVGNRVLKLKRFNLMIILRHRKDNYQIRFTIAGFLTSLNVKNRYNLYM